MSKKKVDERFAVKDDSLKVEKFPVHHNELPWRTVPTSDSVMLHAIPPDTYCKVKIKGYFDDGSGYSGYEIVACRYVDAGCRQWKKGNKWELIGYIKPRTFKIEWISMQRSQWISDQIGTLVKDIQAFEDVMKKRIKGE